MIAQICLHVEGMPLAIELVASSIRSLPLRSLAAEVQDGLQRLETPLRNTPPRHRSMAAVFDQSWRLLTLRQRAILAGLSVFRGGATPEAAGAVTDAQPADLGRLVDASWLRLGRDGRYAIHELVRQYCAARLEEEPPSAAEEMRQRHCAWFGEFLSRQAQHINYHQDVVEKLLVELGNLQTAWHWGVLHGQMDMARNTALSLYFVTDLLGWHHFAIQSYAPIIATLETIIANPATPPAECCGAREVLGWLEYAQGFQFLDLGLVEQARAAQGRFCRAVEGMEECGARRQLLALSGWLVTHVHLSCGEIDSGRQRCTAFMGEIEGMDADFALYGNEVGRKFWLAHGYAALAHCDWYQANRPAAEAHWQKAIALRDEMGERRFCAMNLCAYAHACVTWGRTAQAIGLARRGFALSHSFGDRIGMGMAQLSLGIALAAQGQWAVAAACLQKSLAVGRQSGHRFLHVCGAVHLGRVLLARGDIAAAQAHFDEALDAATRNGSLPYVQLAAVLNSLGMAARARGEWEQAAQYHEQARRQAPHCPAWEVQDALYGQACVCLARGDVAQARALFARVAQDPAASAATREAAQRQMQEL